MDGRLLWRCKACRASGGWCAIPRTTSLLGASGRTAAAGGEECLRAQQAATEKINSLCGVSPAEGLRAPILVTHRRCQARRCLSTITDVGGRLTLGVQRFRPGGDHPLAPAALATVPPSITQPRRAQHSLLRGLCSGELIIPPPSLVCRPVVRAIRTLAALHRYNSCRRRSCSHTKPPRRTTLSLSPSFAADPHAQPTPHPNTSIAPPDRRRSRQGSALPAHQPRSSRSAAENWVCRPRWIHSKGVRAQSRAPLAFAARALKTTTTRPRAPRASTAARRATASAARPTTTRRPRRTRTPP